MTRRDVATYVVIIVLTVPFWLLAAIGIDQTTARPEPTATMSACDSDDGIGPRPCYWDASRHGNGQGKSFYIDDKGEVHY